MTQSIGDHTWHSSVRLIKEMMVSIATFLSRLRILPSPERAANLEAAIKMAALMSNEF